MVCGSCGDVAQRFVDGMNVIGCRPDGWWRDRSAAMRHLVTVLDSWARAGAESVTVVFDGRPVPGIDPVGDVTVVFTPGGRDAADDEIVRMVGTAPDAGAITVVTSDRGLVVRVLALGATVEPSRPFRDLVDPAGRARRRG
jgi:predicted RNA-binding protein with PIN domain